MSIELPKPIADYVEANAQLDVDGMLKPFAADAVVLDNGHRHEGHAEVRTLLEEAVVGAKRYLRRIPFATRTVRSWSKALPMATSKAAQSASPMVSPSKTMPSQPWRSRHDHQG